MMEVSSVNTPAVDPDRYAKRFVRMCLGLGPGLIALVSFAGCEHDSKQNVQMPQRPPAAVTVAAAIVRDVPVYLDEIGKTVAMETVSIVPQVGGKIIACHVEDGALVKKGQVLFEIDPRPFDAALASAEASLAQNQALLQLAKAEFRRFEDAAASAAVSRLEYDQKKNAVDVCEARVDAAKSAVDTAKLNLEYCRISSPIDGRAGARLIFPGNVVRENDAPMLVIQKLDPIYAEFNVTDNDLGTVRKFLATGGLNLAQAARRGLRVEVDIPGDSVRVLSALNGPALTTQPDRKPAGPREGTLTFLDNTVHTGSGTVNLRATVPNADHYFWPGQFVKCRLILTIKKDAVLVPARAEQIGQQGPFVYVVTPEDTAEIRPITAGQPQGDLLVVERGVQPGERVILTGQMSVIPGGKVRVVSDGPGNGPPGAMKNATARANANESRTPERASNARD
jgi:multidrug efflux system membrane fusion protein